MKDVYENAPVDASNGADPGINRHITYGETVLAQSDPFSLEDLRDNKREALLKSLESDMFSWSC